MERRYATLKNYTFDRHNRVYTPIVENFKGKESLSSDTLESSAPHNNIRRKRRRSSSRRRSRVRSKKSGNPQEIEDDSSTMESITHADTIPKEVKPVEIPKEVKPVEIPKEVKPVEIPKEVKPVEIPKEVKPVKIHSDHEDSPFTVGPGGWIGPDSWVWPYPPSAPFIGILPPPVAFPPLPIVPRWDGPSASEPVDTPPKDSVTETIEDDKATDSSPPKVANNLRQKNEINKLKKRDIGIASPTPTPTPTPSPSPSSSHGSYHHVTKTEIVLLVIGGLLIFGLIFIAIIASRK